MEDKEKMRDEMRDEINNLAYGMPIDKFLKMVAEVGEKQKFIGKLCEKYPDATIDELNTIVEELVERESQTKPQEEVARDDN